MSSGRAFDEEAHLVAHICRHEVDGRVLHQSLPDW
jgi:hypothetical protein